VRSRIENRIDGITNLPQDLEKPQIKRVAQNLWALGVSVYGPMTQKQKKNIGDEIYDDLLALSSVQEVQLGGAGTYELSIEVENKILVKEAKISCMKGMLLCLDREQRMIYIIGELFEFTDVIGSEIMEISRENFRIKLHRAKKQLYNFMNDKCGLVNKNNPCRCARKTAGFIKMGYVDPVNLHFQKNTIANINKVIDKKVESYKGQVIPEYQKLFQEHPFLQSPDKLESIKKLLSSKTIKETFNFD
jgi:hypothetical protein